MSCVTFCVTCVTGQLRSSLVLLAAWFFPRRSPGLETSRRRPFRRGRSRSSWRFRQAGRRTRPRACLPSECGVSLGQPVIVENISGASGSTGTGRVARAAGDGHTLMLGNQATHVINSAMMPLPYDVVNDFAPVSLLSTNSQVIVARKTLPANNLKELIAWLKANPDKGTFGTSGVGSIMHLSGVLLQKETGTRFGFVPYRGVVPTLQDLVAGQIDMHDRPGYQCLAPVARGQHQGLCGREPDASASGTRNPDGGRSGIARIPCSWLVWAFCAQGDTGGSHR